MWQLRRADGMPGASVGAVRVAWGIGIGIWVAAMVGLVLLF